MVNFINPFIQRNVKAMKKENKAIFMIVLITLATAIVLFSVHLHQTAKITTSSLTQQDLVGLAAPPAPTVLDQVKGAKKNDILRIYGSYVFQYDGTNWKCTSNDCNGMPDKTSVEMQNYFINSIKQKSYSYESSLVIPAPPPQQFQNGNIIYTNGDKKYIVDHDSYGDDKVYVCKDDKCNTKELCEKCKVDTKGKLNDDGKELGDDPDKIRSDSKDFCKTNMKDEKCDYYATQLASYANIATAPVRAEIERTVGGFASDLLNAAYITHLDSVICGAKYYYDTSGEKGTPVTLGGFELGKSSIPSLQKKDPLNNMYGDIYAGKGQIMNVGGSKEEVIENKLYRYTLSIKLFGQMHYKLYLSNSCDKKKNSLFEGGFSKEGDLTVQGAPDYNVGNYIDYIAGTTLTFDCSKGPCRFNEVCIEHNAPDIANPNCIPLAHGAGFLHKNATSTC